MDAVAIVESSPVVKQTFADVPAVLAFAAEPLRLNAKEKSSLISSRYNMRHVICAYTSLSM